MKLTNIRRRGRYQSPDGKQVNVYKGRRVGYSEDILYYLYRGSRRYISDADFKNWTTVAEC